MRTATVLKTWIVALAILLLLPSQRLCARPPILTLNNVTITQKGEYVVVRVEFNFPLRYVKHFPYESGDDLRIQFEPIRLAVRPGEEAALFTRRSVRPPPNNIASLLEVVYEGNVEGGPFLTLFFVRPVVFTVEQGTDFRSLIIVVHGPEAPEHVPQSHKPDVPREGKVPDVEQR